MGTKSREQYPNGIAIADYNAINATNFASFCCDSESTRSSHERQGCFRSRTSNF
jgi:hypothetical protein